MELNRWVSVAINCASAALTAVVPLLSGAGLPGWVLTLGLVANAALHAIPEPHK